MGVDGSRVKVIQGKVAKGTKHLSHRAQRNKRWKNPLCHSRTEGKDWREIPVSYDLGLFLSHIRHCCY